MGRTLASPLELPGCVLWCRADSAAQFVFEPSTFKIEQWLDASGLAHTLLQPGATGLKPLYNATAGPNGVPAAVFDGVDDYLRALFTLAQPQTVIVLVKPVVAGGYVYDAYGNVFRMCLAINGATQWRILTAGGNVDANVPTTLGWHVMSVVYNGSSNTTIRDNGFKYVSGPAPDGASPASGMTLGGAGNLGGFCAQSVPEVLIYNRALSEAELLRVERYLQLKYALPLEPHPFQPPDLPGCVLWLRADQGVTLEGAGPKISQWNDLSGTAHHVWQTVSGNRPTLNAASASFGNKPSIALNRTPTYFTSSGLSVNPLPINSPRTLFTVTRATDANGGVILCPANSGATSIFYENLNLSVNQVYGLGGAQTVSTAPVWTNTNVFSRYTSNPTGTGLQGFRANGLPMPMTGTPTGTEAGSPTVLLIGTYTPGDTAQNYVGSLAEMILYARVLSLTEIFQVERYLGNRYSLLMAGN